MEYYLEIEKSEQYFKECYSESVKNGSLIQRGITYISPIGLLAGFAIILSSASYITLGYLLIFISSYELIRPFYKRYAWLKIVLPGRQLNTKFSFVFNNQGINISSQNGKSFINWSGIVKAKESPKGLFIWPQNGIYIYFPKSCISNEAIKFVLSKCA